MFSPEAADTASSRAVVAVASSAVPSQSKESVRLNCRVRGSRYRAAITAAMPTGTLAQYT
jgi:hypothetical protein